MPYPQQRKASLPPAIQSAINNLKFGLNGSNPDCKVLGVGGAFQRVLICNRTALLRAVFNRDGQVNGFTNNALTTWYIFTTLENKLSLTIDHVSDENGTVYNSAISGQVYQMSTPQNQMFARMLNQPMAGIVHDRFDTYWLLGSDQPIRLKSLSSFTGSGESELNGYNWSIEMAERVAPVELTKSVINNLVLNPSINCGLPYGISTNTLTFGTCNIASFASTVI